MGALEAEARPSNLVHERAGGEHKAASDARSFDYLGKEHRNKLFETATCSGPCPALKHENIGP